MLVILKIAIAHLIGHVTRSIFLALRISPLYVMLIATYLFYLLIISDLLIFHIACILIVAVICSLSHVCLSIALFS